jgi:hypothetical protein
MLSNRQQATDRGTTCFGVDIALRTQSFLMCMKVWVLIRSLNSVRYKDPTLSHVNPLFHSTFSYSRRFSYPSKMMRSAVVAASVLIGSSIAYSRPPSYGSSIVIVSRPVYSSSATFTSIYCSSASSTPAAGSTSSDLFYHPQSRRQLAQLAHLQGQRY